mmetsp:Transcript_44377/g.81370  ORF Transcript_44377/g.81370 Transcript_44377/m.81370 type:complete len:84 (+) Transcript_44377:417-668(+)
MLLLIWFAMPQIWRLFVLTRQAHIQSTRQRLRASRRGAQLLSSDASKLAALIDVLHSAQDMKRVPEPNFRARWRLLSQYRPSW